MERNPISREGWEMKKQEIADLDDKIAEVAEMIKLARAEGDLSENTEYHGQRETQGMLQAKQNLLKSQLANCQIIDKADMPKDIVAFGSQVTVKNLDDGLDEIYEMVGPGEEDYTGDVMKILTSSPLAQGLLGKKIGATVEVEIPNGMLRLEVTAIDVT